MSNLITFSLKKNKQKGYNVLFIKINSTNLSCDNATADKFLDEFKKHVIENPGVLLIYDIRMVENINKKLMWEKASSLVSFNAIAKKNIKATSVISNSKLMVAIIKTVSKVHPFVTPIKFVNNNKDALNFIESYL